MRGLGSKTADARSEDNTLTGQAVKAKHIVKYIIKY